MGERLRMPVVLAGRGPLKTKLLRMAERASVPVRVVESPSDVELVALYQKCRALIFPAVEDFGMVPVEAQACGTPVVALNRGGSRDTVRRGETGWLSDAQDIDAFVQATRCCLELGDVSDVCVRNAQRFSATEFDRRFASWVAEATGTQFRMRSTH